MGETSKTIFNAYVADPESFLDSLPLKTKVPVQRDGKKFLVSKKENGSLNFEDITEQDERSYVSHASISDLSGNIADMMKLFEDKLGEITRYTIQMTEKGQIISVPVEDKFTFITMSNKGSGQYFDSTVRGKDEMLSYNMISGSFGSHTGDVVNNGHLFHGVSIKPRSQDYDFTFTVVGYHATPLISYVEQQPFVGLINHQEQVIYIIPLPLEEVVLGTRSTFAHVLSARIKTDSTLVVYIPETILTLEKCDTNTRNSKTEQSVNEQIMIMNRALDRATEVPSEAAEVPSEAAEVPSEAAEVPSEAAEVIIQNGLGIDPASIQFFDNQKTIGFDRGFTEPKYDLVDPVDINYTPLPILGGSIIGTVAALGRIPEPGMIPRVEDNRKIIIVLGSGKHGMLDSVAKTETEYRINTLFVIISDLPDPEERAVEVMNNINVASLNALGGPCQTSIVRFKSSEGYTYRFYRGMYTDPVRYGDLISFPQLSEDLPFSLFQKKDDKRVCWRGKMIDQDQLFQNMLKMSYEDIIELREEFVKLFDQIKTLMNEKQIRDFSGKVTSFLESLVDKSLKSHKEKIRNCLESDDPEQLKKISADMKGIKKKLNRGIKFVADLLSKLTSVRGVTYNYQSVKAAQRANLIKTNAIDCSSMSLQDRLEYLSGICDTYLIIILDSDSLVPLLRQARDASLVSTMSGWVGQQPEPFPFRQDPRSLFLDSNVYEVITNIKGGNQCRHPLKGDRNLAIPAGHTANKETIPCLGIPLVRELSTIQDPGSIIWTNECNKPEMAYWRIWARQTIADGHGRIINERNPELGFILVHILLCCMESITSSMTNPPEPNSIVLDDLPLNVEAMRAIFCHFLSTLASTQMTLSPLYKLVYSSEVELPKKNEWWILIRMTRVFSYTGWSRKIQTRYFHNLRTLISRLVYNRVLSSAIAEMNKQDKVQKEKDPDWLNYLHLLTDVIFEAARGKIDLDQKLAKKLLSMSPGKNKLSRGTNMITSYIYVREYLLDIQKGKDPAMGFLRTVMVALFSYVKHSGNITGDNVPEFFKSHGEGKKGLRKSISCACDIESLREIYDTLTEGKISSWKSCPNPEYEKTLSSVLGSKEVYSEDPGETEVCLEISLADKLQKIPGGKKLVKILTDLNSLSQDSSPIERVPIYQLISLLDKDPVATYKEMVENMVRERHNFDDCIQAGVISLT